jgi:hypothetical protein
MVGLEQRVTCVLVRAVAYQGRTCCVQPSQRPVGQLDPQKGG